MQSYQTFPPKHTHAHSHGHSHSSGSPWEEEHISVSGRVADILTGLMDGSVFAYCVVIGLSFFTDFHRKDLVLLGCVSVLAHATASFGSNWNNVTLQNERDDIEVRMEQLHLKHHPDEEDTHIALLLRDRLGLSDSTIALIIQDAKSCPGGSLRLHSKIELGLNPDAPKSSPFWSGFDRFFSLIVGGLLILAPWFTYFFANPANSFFASSILTLLLLVVVGSFNSTLSVHHPKKARIIALHFVPTVLGFIAAALLAYTLSLVAALPANHTLRS